MSRFYKVRGSDGLCPDISAVQFCSISTQKSRCLSEFRGLQRHVSARRLVQEQFYLFLILRSPVRWLNKRTGMERKDQAFLLWHTHQRWEWKPDVVLLSDETRATPPMAPANLPLLGTLRDTQDPERGTGQLFRAGHMLTLPCLPWIQVSKRLSSFAFSPAPEPTLRTC